MQLFLKGLRRGVILFGILLIVSLWKYGLEDYLNTYIFNSLIAFFLGWTSVIYEIKQWSFLKQILAHYLTMLITVFPTLLLSGMYPLTSFNDLLNVYFQFNKAGIILFFTTYFIFKLIRKFNSGKSKAM